MVVWYQSVDEIFQLQCVFCCENVLEILQQGWCNINTVVVFFSCCWLFSWSCVLLVSGTQLSLTNSNCLLYTISDVVTWSTAKMVFTRFYNLLMSLQSCYCFVLHDIFAFIRLVQVWSSTLYRSLHKHWRPCLRFQLIIQE